MENIAEKVRQGKIFIYPTDTIYGLGCNALNNSAVEKIKQIKNREKDKPLSIIAPSKTWIRKNCIVDADLNRYLPGPYTLILKKKNPNFLSHVSDTDSLGIRIPNNSFTKLIQRAGVPFITTSVNLVGEKPITNTYKIPEQIKKQVDIIINAGILNGKPSTLIINGKKIKRKCVLQ